uniref:Oxidative stress 3 n=1 Tax=Ananas comosus var. bracteatus TaxID=296719 RepID=A0A6V7QJ53_ANACO|nr:unnamed protein product [Ananas comosus var. bracteatus]
MGEGLNQLFYGVFSLPRIEDADECLEESSFYGGSDESVSSSTSDLTDDATSPAPKLNTSQIDENGPLYELSSLMEDLPIRKGLSKYYKGKSQSFSCLSNVRCIEDLAKKENPYRKRMKTCKSYAGGLDAQKKPSFAPGPYSRTISKKPSRVSCASLLSKRSSSNGLLYSSRTHGISVHKHL